MNPEMELILKRYLPPSLTLKEFASMVAGGDTQGAIAPRHGLDIFPDKGACEPTQWEDIKGQERAVDLLSRAVARAHRREQRLPHILLSHGSPGVAKSSLARLTAFQMGAGVVELSGQVSADEAYDAIRGMNDQDVLLLDEAHLLQTQTKGAWLLQLMQDGRILTARGPQECPDITVIGTTTDLGRMTEASVSRFLLKPALSDMEEETMIDIARRFASAFPEDSAVDTNDDEQMGQVARAAAFSPRQLKGLLEAVDLYDGDIDAALESMGLLQDGLNTNCVKYLTVLVQARNNTASEKTLQGSLAEPTLQHIERPLLRLGYIELSGRGRALTSRGRERLVRLLQEGT